MEDMFFGVEYANKYYVLDRSKLYIEDEELNELKKEATVAAEIEGSVVEGVFKVKSKNLEIIERITKNYSLMDKAAKAGINVSLNLGNEKVDVNKKKTGNKQSTTRKHGNTKPKKAKSKGNESDSASKSSDEENKAKPPKPKKVKKDKMVRKPAKSAKQSSSSDESDAEPISGTSKKVETIKATQKSATVVKPISSSEESDPETVLQASKMAKQLVPLSKSVDEPAKESEAMKSKKQGNVMDKEKISKKIVESESDSSSDSSDEESMKYQCFRKGDKDEHGVPLKLTYVSKKRSKKVLIKRSVKRDAKRNAKSVTAFINTLYPGIYKRHVLLKGTWSGRKGNNKKLEEKNDEEEDEEENDKENEGVNKKSGVFKLHPKPKDVCKELAKERALKKDWKIPDDSAINSSMSNSLSHFKSGNNNTKN